MFHTKSPLLLPVLFVVLMAVDSLSAQDAKPKNHTVARGPLRVEVELDGTFEAAEMVEVSLRPKEWTSLTVVEAVAAGTAVKAGDALIRLETEDLDKSLTALGAEHMLSEMTLKQAEQDLKLLEASTPAALEAAERAARTAREDLQRYLKVGEGLAKKGTDYSLRSSEFFLQNQLEELHQLEKMYKEDDLTEETEEIVLRRQQFAVDQARFSLERAKSRNEVSHLLTLPRQKIGIEETARTSEIEWQRARVALPVKLGQQRLDVVKMRRKHEEETEKIENLQADRKLLTIKATSDGVVYYGRCTRGKWSGQAEAEKQLQPHGKLLPGSVVMTVVAPGNLRLRTNIAEKHIGQVRPATRVTAVPTAYPDVRLNGKVQSVSTIAVSASGHDGTVAVDIPNSSPAIVAGMTGKITVHVYSRDDVIAIPSGAVFTDDKGQRYVCVVDGDKHERRDVTTGARSSTKIEILKGIKAGEVVSTEKPAS